MEGESSELAALMLANDVAESKRGIRKLRSSFLALAHERKQLLTLISRLTQELKHRKVSRGNQQREYSSV